MSDVSVFSGDIGGNVGLWIGATVLTVFELLDFLLHTFLNINLRKRLQQRNQPSAEKYKVNKDLTKGIGLEEKENGLGNGFTNIAMSDA